MDYRETPFFFDCQGAALLAVLATPAEPAATSRIGVVIVVGGPQYRVGSHRQFVLLARTLASAGFACLRFDYRGMGDSDGELISFEEAQPDIRAAIDVLCRHSPSVEKVVLWGLCDGATACTFAAATDVRVGGLALFNPWVRTETGVAQALIKRYYMQRIFDRRFWRKLIALDVNIGKSASEWMRHLFLALGWKRGFPSQRAVTRTNKIVGLPERVAQGLASFAGPTLIALSENDLTADEFRGAAARPGLLADVLRRRNTRRVELAGADHTLSQAAWQDGGTAITLDWLRGEVQAWHDRPRPVHREGDV